MSTSHKIINNAYQNLANLRAERTARLETGHGDEEDALMRDILTAQMEGMQARFMIDPAIEPSPAPARTVVANNDLRGEAKPIMYGHCTACGRSMSWMELTKGMTTCIAKNLCAQRAAKRGQ